MNEIKNITQDGAFDKAFEFCKAVYSTMGPGGRNVIIETGEVLPLVTKDGVTVAESINYGDPMDRALTNLIKEAARKTATEVGDGTTTSILLTERMLSLGDYYLNKGGIKNKREFFDTIDEAVMLITDYLNDSTIQVEGNIDILKSIVKISSNSDKEITNLIMQAVEKAGADGIINVKPSDDMISSIEIASGASIDSTIYVDAIGESQKALIVLIEGAVTDIHQILPILQHAGELGPTMPVIIVAKEFKEDVLKIIKVNILQKRMFVIPVLAEGFGSNRLEILSDLSLITDAVILSTDNSTGLDTKAYIPNHAGTVTNVNYTQSELVFTPTTEIIPEVYESTVESLKEAYREAKTNIDTSKSSHIKRRLSKFSNVATITVGGTTKGEMLEREARITDAVCAVSAAMSGGVVPGGGRALQCATKVLEVKIKEEEDKSRIDAFKLMYNVCMAPIIVLCENLGVDWEDFKNNPEFIDEKVVLDMINLVPVDAYKEGILDPVLVPVNALKNAVSVAKTILRSQVMVVPKPLNG